MISANAIIIAMLILLISLRIMLILILPVIMLILLIVMQILLLIVVEGVNDVQLSFVGQKSSFGGIGYDAFCFSKPPKPVIKVSLCSSVI